MDPKTITSKFKFTIKIIMHRDGALCKEWYAPDVKKREDLAEPDYFVAEGYVLDPLYAKHYGTEQEALADLHVVKEKVGEHGAPSVHFFDPDNESTWSMRRSINPSA